MSSLMNHTGKQYWQSLNELAEDPAFVAKVKNEFPSVPWDTEGQLSRRRFMQLMGASFGLAGAAGCRWPKEEILPHTHRPAGHVAGVPQHYHTSFELGGYGIGLTVTSYDGRPIKIEGNKNHPFSAGGTTAFAQASLLELYDPDRSTGAVRYDNGKRFPHFAGEAVEQLKDLLKASISDGGVGLRVLAEPSFSPTLQRLRNTFLEKYTKASWCEYTPFTSDNERLGSQKAFGQAFRSHYHLDKVKVLVTLDDDFLTQGPAAVRYARDFAGKRKPSHPQGMLRSYAIESKYTLTGAQADHRLSLSSQDIKGFLLLLAQEVIHLLPQEPQGLQGISQAVSLSGHAEASRLAKVLAKELVSNRGHALITVGQGQPPEVWAIAHYLNQVFGAVGSTVSYTQWKEAEGPSTLDSFHQLYDEMKNGDVKTLIILGGDPVYASPADLDVAGAMNRVAHRFHLSLYEDETSKNCTWHIPQAHYLESFGDSRSFDGTVTLQQPLIAPLYQGLSSIDIAGILVGEQKKSRELVQETLALEAKQLGLLGDSEQLLKEALKIGYLKNSAWSEVRPPEKILDRSCFSFSQKPKDELELTFWPDVHTYDGRFANNAWLQELPDFLTKLTWDNALLIAPATAEKFGIKQGQLLQLAVSGRELKVAAYLMPGQAVDSVALSLGHGRLAAGHIGGHVDHRIASTGFASYALWAGASVNFLPKAKIQPLSGTYLLATTQEHHVMTGLAEKAIKERLHEIVREADLVAFQENPHIIKEQAEHAELRSLWKEKTYETGHRWGLVIDLNSCTGCNACVVACQAENNIPVVGKEQVLRGRQMHWLRIDRYFSGERDAPKIVSQPMLCQQCENAPCEQVCPVAATVHSSEGLNDMVYNRCIGTRYCSNNCPYKVRRFNYFNYHKELEQSDRKTQVAKMVYNPEVTVRARGVMEKCTYCVQRIQNVKIQARNRRRSIQDGEIVTACAEACPSAAITFGDLNDEHSQIAQLAMDPRNYAVLAELNTKPRTTYLAKINNHNPELD